MDEDQIVNSLKQNLPKPYETDLAPPPETDTTTGQATIAPEFELDELTLYKLHDFFGLPYKEHDEMTNQQARYVYNEVSKMVGTTEYSVVMAKIIDLEGILGIRQTENRMVRLHQWLRLDNIRKSTENEMHNLRGAA